MANKMPQQQGETPWHQWTPHPCGNPSPPCHSRGTLIVTAHPTALTLRHYAHRLASLSGSASEAHCRITGAEQRENAGKRTAPHGETQYGGVRSDARPCKQHHHRTSVEIPRTGMAGTPPIRSAILLRLHAYRVSSRHAIRWPEVSGQATTRQEPEGRRAEAGWHLHVAWPCCRGGARVEASRGVQGTLAAVGRELGQRARYCVGHARAAFGQGPAKQLGLSPAGVIGVVSCDDELNVQESLLKYHTTLKLNVEIKLWSSVLIVVTEQQSRRAPCWGGRTDATAKSKRQFVISPGPCWKIANEILTALTVRSQVVVACGTTAGSSSDTAPGALQPSAGDFGVCSPLNRHKRQSFGHGNPVSQQLCATPLADSGHTGCCLEARSAYRATGRLPGARGEPPIACRRNGDLAALQRPRIVRVSGDRQSRLGWPLVCSGTFPGLFDVGSARLLLARSLIRLLLRLVASSALYAFARGSW